MILFKNDYVRYPNAIIDIECSNKSFIRLASVYREMGIKNNAFILVLLNPKLQGVDPFDPNLTIEQMAMVAVECRDNPFYFLRTCARAPGLGSNESRLVEANRGNIALFWCFFNHIMTILIQPRQTGKSFTVDVLVILLMNIICQNTQINLLTKDDTLRRINISRLKETSLEIPGFLQQNSKEDANNGEEITISRLKNTLLAHVPQSSPKRAYNMGRGLTSPIFIVDEPPFQPNISISLPAALAATGAAVDAAKKNGTPYGTILTTTAGKKDDRDGKFVYGIMTNSAVWTEKFFDTDNLEDLEKTIKHNSRTGVVRVNITLNHRQLGKTDAWLKEKIDESLQTGEDAARDYLCQWSSGSGSNPLPVHILDKIAKSVKPVEYSDISIPHGYITRWYIPEDEIHHRLSNSKIVMGMDTSDASGGDDIAFVMTDVETLDVLCVLITNETNLITYSEWICSILVSYPNITAIIERRSTGGMILDYLLLMLPQHNVDPFKRLFNRVVNDYDEYPDRYREINLPMGRRSSDIYVKYKKTFGFATSATGYASRNELYSTTLQNAAKRSCEKIYDKSLIDQITGLINKNGRIDHDDGEHDDLVIAYLLGHWLLTHGKNLSHYGIDTSKVMTRINTLTNEVRILDKDKAMQQSIRDRIEELYDKLSTEPDDFVCLRLEHELKLLDKQIILENDEVYSMDSLIARAKEVKRNKRRGYNQQKQDTFDYRSTYADNNFAISNGVFSDKPLTTNEIYTGNY